MLPMRKSALLGHDRRVGGEVAAAKLDTIKRIIGAGGAQIGSVVGAAYATLKLFPGGHP